MDRKHITKFIKFAITSGIATLADIFVLWFLTSIIGVFYLISATIAFILGSSLNYSINYIWTFKGTKTNKIKGLISFILIGAGGLVLTILLMAFFVEILNIHYLIARILSAFFVLIWNYTLNSIITFRQQVLFYI
jgi:putative flippase GtrA